MVNESLLKKYQSPLLCAILAVLILAAFEPVRHNDFVDYDDQAYITLNHHIFAGINYDSLIWAFTSGYASNWHPLTWLSHMLDIELFGLNPVGHHAHNLALHIAGTLLLFLILQNITGAVWPSALVAMAFGIHPLRVESVAWAAERKDVLCAFFWMLTTAAYIGYARHGGIFRYLLVILCLCLGLMAKPMIVTLPIIFLLLDVWPLRRIKNLSPQNDALEPALRFRPASVFQLIMEKIPLFILVAVSCVVTYKVQYWSGTVEALNITWFQKFTNVFVSYITYPQKIIWPVHLASLYPFPENGWPIWKPVVALILLAGVSAFAVYAARKRPWLLVGWLWYIIVLLPVIGLVQIGNHATADRYSYLPSIGILIMLAWTAEEFSVKRPYRKTIFAVLSGVLAIAMIMATRIQVTYWKDGFTLNKRCLAVTENNYVACNNMGVVFLEQKKYDEALPYLQKALELHPNYYLAKTNMATLMKEFHQYDKALAYIDDALEDLPYEGLAYLIQGRIFSDMGKYEAALSAYKKSAKLDPSDFRPLYDAGVLLAKQGAMKEAIQYFEACLRCYPNWSDAYRDMGLAFQRLGLIDNALSSYRKAIEMNSNDYITRYRAGYCFQEIGHPRDAIYFYRQALKIKPDLLQALDKLAWLLATSPDSDIRNPSEAVRLAEKAAQMTAFNDYRILNTLAAAYAGQKQFGTAVDILNKAITLAQANNDAESVQQFVLRLNLYQRNQAYLEPFTADPGTKNAP